MEFRKQSQAARVKSIPEMVQSSALSSALALTRLGRGRGRWGEQGGEAGEGLRGCGGGGGRGGGGGGVGGGGGGGTAFLLA